MITATALVVSYFSGPLLNFGDFSRYGKSMGEIRRGNRWGLPFNFLLFSVVTVVIVSGTQSLFGKMITDPIETVSRVGNDLAVAIGLLTMITATIALISWLTSSRRPSIFPTARRRKSASVPAG
ncbi:cytosine/purine/uracil/thiamine/allantoin permease family protein [Klebsiella pneumoniae]|uniref:Cytosine/purine/uracil/thiamine/allantoin permease family protein n=1 Tax=Klebsiella pneumoniae TaxID=573 RepID=A0A2X1QHE4_KLEPN|nr:cytosine/purine/uracil/thiamine/allantoin permease family protein [Klebsiella pneumoniae]